MEGLSQIENKAIFEHNPKANLFFQELESNFSELILLNPRHEAYWLILVVTSYKPNLPHGLIVRIREDQLFGFKALLICTFNKK